MTANRKKGWIVIAKGKYHYWLTEDISDTLKNNKDIIDRKVENALLENALGSKQVETIEEAVKDSDTGKVELKVVKKTEELVWIVVLEAEIAVFESARSDWMNDIKR